MVLASSMVVYGEGRYVCSVHGDVRPAPRLEPDLSTGDFEPRCERPECLESLVWAPIDELSPLDPRNVYAATKLHQEHLCGLWAREAGASLVSLRYHNVYGSRMPEDTPYAGVASIFRSSLAEGRAPLVFEDGGQTRDFVHVSDVAEANLLALGGTPGIYNVASGTPHTVGDLAGALTTAMGSPLAPVVTGTWRAGDVRHIVASPARAAEHLGFVARVGLDEGMADFAGGRQPARR